MIRQFFWGVVWLAAAASATAQDEFDSSLAAPPLATSEQAAPAPVTAPAPASATTQPKVMYINDYLLVQIRTAPDEASEYVKVVPSGTRLDVLGVSENKRYTHVRLEGGEQGWVASQYLIKEPIARDQLEVLRKEHEALVERSARTAAQLKEIGAERKTLDDQRRQLERENTGLKSELEQIKSASSRALELVNENRGLVAKNQELAARTAEVEGEYAALSRNVYLLIGITAFVALGIGFYIGSAPVRREKSWRALP